MRIFAVRIFAAPFALTLAFVGLVACHRGTEVLGHETPKASCSDDQQGRAPDGSCVPCTEGTYLSPAGTCDPIAGTALSHEFPEGSIGPGEEQTGGCRSWTLGNETELWVNAVELVQDEDSHHSNWVFVPEDKYVGPDGEWPCADRGYEFYAAVNQGGLLYAQSTQAPHEVQKFPEGAAIRVPPHVRIISDVHRLNATSEGVTGTAKLTLYAVDPSAVTTPLTAFHIEYDALDLPPLSSSRFTGDCRVAGDVESETDAPFAPQVYYVLPHTHTHATAFYAAVSGGVSDGVPLLDLGGYNGEAHGKVFDPPVDMTGATGFTFYCQYDNPTADHIGWGVGTDEMCEMFGFASGTVFFQSGVVSGHSDGAEGDVQLFTGECTTTVLDGK
ncbi:MAG: hypothetical protein U0414_17360 [Polyangiaceae bacterium]